MIWNQQKFLPRSIHVDQNRAQNSDMIVPVPDSKSRNIPEVIVVRRGAVGVLGIWEGLVNWVKGGANGVSLQATWEGGGRFLSQLEGVK